MRYTYIIVGILIKLVFTGCENHDEQISTFSLNDTTELLMHETIFNYESQISISMDSVLSDSRCPMDVICFWAGNAEVRFTFSHKKQDTVFNLNTHGGSHFRSDSSINGFNIRLLELFPYPETTNDIHQTDYYAKIIVDLE